MNAIIGIILEKLWEKLEPKLEEQFAKLLPMIVDKITALLPVVVAAATKAIGDQITAHIPDLNLPDLPDLAETVRETVNQIPDIDIPVLSDIFDLTEFLGGKRS